MHIVTTPQIVMTKEWDSFSIFGMPIVQCFRTAGKTKQFALQEEDNIIVR